MKVGVVTFHFAVNYGAVLQAFATCSMLKRLGHDPSIIDYRPSGSLYEHYHKWALNRFGINSKNLLKLRLNPKFSMFRKQWLPIASEVIDSPERLAQHSRCYDAILYGSDQIWNPSIFDGQLDAGYWARAVPKEVRRIAFSASFGGDLEAILPLRAKINELARNFDALSVREKDALQVFDKPTSRSVIQLADPVFGNDDWDPLLETAGCGTNVVFEFSIQTRISFKQTSRSIANSIGTDFVCADARFNLRRKQPRSLALSVGQWLWVIKNAKLVVTDSFHATVFCIIFNTPFIFVPLEGRQGNPNPRNNRIFDLLEWTGLESRIWRDRVAPSCVSDVVSMGDQGFAVANRAVAQRRSDLNEYLRSQLETSGR